MKLESLRLVNIRAFEDSGEIQFQNGTISIYGENGAGKSTIVTSIGRTIFGWDDGVKQATIDYAGERHRQGVTEYLLRKGAAEGSIDATFSHKGHVYRVRHVLSRTTQSWELYIDGEKTDLYGKQEIHERIRDELGMAEIRTSSADSLFSDVICVLQGQVINEFEFTSQKRKDHFDKVLGLYSYRQAYSDSVHVKNNFKSKIARAESEARVLEAEIAHLSGLVHRLREYERELKNLRQSIGAVEAKLSAVENQKQTYESLRAELENFKRELSTADVKAGDVATAVETANREVQNCREAQNVVEERRPSFVRYQHIAGQLDEVRALARQVTSEATRLAELRVAHASVTSAKTNALKELQQFDEASDRVTQLSPIAAEYTQLAEALSQLKLDQQRYQAGLERIKATAELIRTKGLATRELETELEEYGTLKERAERLETLLREYDELARKVGELDGHKKQMEKDLDSLLKGVCPYTSDRCESIEERGHRHEHELEAIRAELALLQSKRDERASAISEAREAARQLQLLDGKQRELELKLEEIDTLRRELSGERDSVQAIGDNVARMTPLEERIEALKGSADEYQSLAYALKKSDRSALVSGLAELSRRDQALQSDIEGAEDTIAHLTGQGGDEALLSRLEHELRELQKDYDSYVASVSLAANLEEAIERHNTCARDLAALAERRQKLAVDIEAISKLYDAAEHLRIEKDSLETRQHLNEMRGIASQLSRQIEDLKPQEAALVVKREDLMALDVELNEIAADGKFFDEIRDSFKNLSAMRPLYTKKVSQQAARHWRQMVNDESQLHWQEDYLVFKADGGNVISLYEMSGGEKVSACLAVRLAMQETLSGLGLFILDEPTIHLDEERCDSLAQQIGAIKGLNQIIVISHDDTFHAYTQQQITIRKDPSSHASVVEL
ncbi:MAG: AAA family ATPase [Halobacteriota archaeon]